MLTTKNPQDESFRPNLKYLAVLIRTAARGPARTLYRFSDGWGPRDAWGHLLPFGVEGKAWAARRHRN
jgi:hypothetical protein